MKNFKNEKIKNYFEMIKIQAQTFPKKQALIVDGISYTYEELSNRVEKIRQEQFLPGHSEKKQLYLIHEDNILSQLLLFLACQGTNYIPLIVPYDHEVEEFKNVDSAVPDNSIMAVCTSGSSGTPKILYRNLNSWYDFFSIQNEIFHINEDTRMFVQGSLAFTGNLNLYMDVLSVGATLVAENGFYPHKWEQVINAQGVNPIYLIPSKLMLLPGIYHEPNFKVHTILAGSQSLGQEDVGKLKKIFPNTKIVLYYGASELNYITYVTDDQMGTQRNLIGKPFPGVEVYIKEEEMYVNTPYHVEGIEVPFSLKDSGYQDQEGNFYFLGRKDDIINIRGRKVSALKIENAVAASIEGIQEVAVAALLQGEEQVLTAFVVFDEKYKEIYDTKTFEKSRPPKQIREQLQKVLKTYEIPRYWITMAQLPKTDSGKVNKKQLSRCISL